MMRSRILLFTLPFVALPSILVACGEDAAPISAPTGNDSGSGETSTGTDGNVLPDSSSLTDGGSDARPDAPPPTPVNVTVRGFDYAAQTNIALLAYQDGDGPWTVATGTAGVYSFTIKTGRYGVAWVCSMDTSKTATAVYLATTESTTLTATCNKFPQVLHLTGTITGLPDTDVVAISAAGRFVGNITSADPTYSLGISSGLYDVTAERRTVDIGKTNKVIRRTINFTTNQAQNFDFDAQGFVPEEHTATVNGATSGETDQAVGTSWRTNLGTTQPLAWAEPLGFLSVPAASLTLNDIQFVEAYARDVAANTTRSTILAKRTPGNETFTLPSLLSGVTISAATTTGVRLKASLAPWPQAQTYVLTAHQTAPSLRTFTVSATAGWLGAANPVALEFPLIHGLAGWDNAWSHLAGTSTSWTMQARTTNRAVADVLPTAPTYSTAAGLDGRVEQSAQVSGTIVP